MRPAVVLALLLLTPALAAQATISDTDILISTEIPGIIRVTTTDGCKAYITPDTAEGYSSLVTVDPPTSLAVFEQTFSLRSKKAGSTRLRFQILGEKFLVDGDPCNYIQEVFVDVTVVSAKEAQSAYKKQAKPYLTAVKAAAKEQASAVSAGLTNLAGGIAANPQQAAEAVGQGSGIVLDALAALDAEARGALIGLAETGSQILADQGFAQAIMPAGLQRGGGGEHDAFVAAMEKDYAGAWKKIASSWAKFIRSLESITADSDNAVRINSVLRPLQLPTVNGPSAPDATPPASPPAPFQLPLTVAISPRGGSSTILLVGLASDLDDVYELRLLGPDGLNADQGIAVDTLGRWALTVSDLPVSGNHTVNIARNLDPVLAPVDVVNVAVPAVP